MKQIKDHVWVVYPKTYQEEAKQGDLILWKDVSYKPEWNVIQHGKVIQTSLGSSMIENRGIIDETQIEDTIYFNYAIPEAGDEFYTEDDVRYMRVPLWAIYCSIRKGRIIPIGSHVLTKPIYDEHEEIEIEGKKIKAKIQNGLVVSTKVEHDKRFTKIAYIGTPLEGGEFLGLNSGDIVMMDTHCDNEIEIEGEKFFIMKQENILMKWQE
jgi:co-chaperonin GroES (HSP10)